jgi:hypothetical protein
VARDTIVMTLYIWVMPSTVKDVHAYSGIFWKYKACPMSGRDAVRVIPRKLGSSDIIGMSP